MCKNNNSSNFRNVYNFVYLFSLNCNYRFIRIILAISHLPLYIHVLTTSLVCLTSELSRTDGTVLKCITFYYKSLFVPPLLTQSLLLLSPFQGDAKPLYLSMFITVLHGILRNNPTWGFPGHTKYFLQVLQCPDCKAGLWSLLETSVRYETVKVPIKTAHNHTALLSVMQFFFFFRIYLRVCLASEKTCHSLPSPPSTELFRLHCNLQEFFLRLFQLELHAASSG